MNEYMYLMAAVIGILIAILLKRKDIAEILRMHREIKRLMQSM